MNIYISLLITMAFSAFFSGMEIAFVSVDKLRFEMERKGGITSRILSIFFKNSNEFISTMLVGNNIALVIYGILMAQIIGDNLLAGFIDNHFLMVLAQTVISTLIILVTGEFLPKTLFKINPNLVLNVAAIPLFICYVILYPVSKLSSGLSCLFLRIFGMKVNKDASDKAFGKVDLDYFVQSSIDNAANEEELDTEVKIFQNALDFSNIKIRDCIVPRTEVVAVDLTTSLDELKSRFIESGISKIIVYDGNIDNVVGFIHSSEMFRDPKDWRDNVKDVPIVPETMSAHKLMKLFMLQKRTIAVVVDEFGGTSGIVSLEDLVEEIFGDIEDEHDNTSYICKKIDEDEYVLSAREVRHIFYNLENSLFFRFFFNHLYRHIFYFYTSLIIFIDNSCCFLNISFIIHNLQQFCYLWSFRWWWSCLFRGFGNRNNFLFKHDIGYCLTCIYLHVTLGPFERHEHES